jgi:endonuclease YncB( thermonuclease family)
VNKSVFAAPISGTVSPLSKPWPDQLGGGLDEYKRTLGDVILPDGMNVNQEHVKQGWWYRGYAPGDTVLEGLETEAREGKKGLWADPQPVPPWEWRIGAVRTSGK